MNYRIEVQNLSGDWVGPFTSYNVSDEVDNLLGEAAQRFWRGLPVPDGAWSGIRAQFYFTEEGWERFGERLHRFFQLHHTDKVKMRVLTVDDSAKALYRDEYQVAFGY